MDLIKKLDELSERYKEVSQLITDPNLLKDQKKYKDTMRENQYLSTLMELYDEYKKVLSGIEDAKMMITAEETSSPSSLRRRAPGCRLQTQIRGRR
jgi:peptide chain release factor 1